MNSTVISGSNKSTYLIMMIEMIILRLVELLYNWGVGTF